MKDEHIDKIVDTDELKEELKGRIIKPGDYDSMLCIAKKGNKISAVIFGCPFDLAELSHIAEEKLPDMTKLIKNTAVKIAQQARSRGEKNINKIINENESAIFEAYAQMRKQ